MASVGVVSALLGARAIWIIPCAFVTAMAIGGIFGLNGIMMSHAEIWIAASLVMLGITIALNEHIPKLGKVIPLRIVAFFVIAFGAAHGNAHGVEIPNSAEPATFVIGFLIGTSVLHLTGVAVGILSINKQWFAVILRLGGLFTAALGVGLLTR